MGLFCWKTNSVEWSQNIGQCRGSRSTTFSEPKLKKKMVDSFSRTLRPKKAKWVIKWEFGSEILATVSTSISNWFWKKFTIGTYFMYDRKNMYINSSDLVRLTLKLKHWGYWQSLVRIFSSFSHFDCASKCKIPDNWAYLELVKWMSCKQSAIFFSKSWIYVPYYMYYTFTNIDQEKVISTEVTIFKYLIEKVCFFSKISQVISS